MRNSFKCVALLMATGLFVSGCASTVPEPTKSATHDKLVDHAARAALPTDIQQSGKLRVGIDTTYAPNEYQDSAGNPVGWEVELMHAIAQKLGVRVEYHQVVFDSIIPGVQQSKFDLGLSSFFDTTDRRKLVDMVDYYSAGILWVQKANSTSVFPDKACGLAIGVQAGTFESDIDLPNKSKECQRQKQDPITVLEYSNQSDANDAVELGRASAFVADSPVSLFAIKESLGGLVQAGTVYSTLDYAMPTKQKSSLSKALRLAIQSAIDDGTYGRILHSWGVSAGAIAESKINGVVR